jgi:hypothetical protein
MRFPFLIACLLLSAAAASAAAPERTVMGIEIGSRFLLPECSGSGTFTSRPCINASLTNRKPWGADEYHVALPRSMVPPYVRGEVRVATVQGIVESVQVGTWGLQSQGGALADLTKQFGQPTRTREQPRAANSRFAAKFAEWDLNDLSVKFEGSTGSIDWGLIDVATERYRKRVRDYEQKK